MDKLSISFEMKRTFGSGALKLLQWSLYEPLLDDIHFKCFPLKHTMNIEVYTTLINLSSRYTSWPQMKGLLIIWHTLIFHFRIQFVQYHPFLLDIWIIIVSNLLHSVICPSF